MSFIATVQSQEFSFIVEYEHDSPHKISINNSSDATHWLSHDSDDIGEITNNKDQKSSGYNSLDSPEDEAPHKLGGSGWNFPFTWVESVFWAPLYATEYVTGFSLLITTKDDSSNLRVSLTPAKMVFMVGVLAISHWNQEQSLFNQIQQQEENLRYELTIITDGKNQPDSGSNTTQLQEHSSNNSHGRASSNSQHSPDSLKTNGSGGDQLGSKYHTYNFVCHADQCNGKRCKKRRLDVSCKSTSPDDDTSAKKSKPSKKHPCDLCSYNTTEINNLSRHQAEMHATNAKTTYILKCVQCIFSTDRKYALDRHLTTHLNQRELICSHQCPKCSYKTNYKSNLNRHENTHLNKWERTYAHQCSQPDCLFQTNQIGDLNRHKNTH